jgi:hypothetical protein
MNLVQRVQAIVLKPKEEWIKIKAEQTTVNQLFMSYAVILAAIPAAAQFIGFGLIGQKVPFVGWYRYSLGSALLRSIFSYILSLVAVYVFAMVINALAPNFSSAQNMPNAMKLAVFGMTPGWVAGVLNIFPDLSFLVVLASLYGLYVLYLGFNTPMMETPKEKVMGYYIVSIVAAVVLVAVAGLIVTAMFAVRGVTNVL